MSKRDILMAGIILVALVSIPYLLFATSRQYEIKTYGAIAFGLILAFGALNLILAWRDTVRRRKRDQENQGLSE